MTATPCHFFTPWIRWRDIRALRVKACRRFKGRVLNTLILDSLRLCP